MCYYSYYERVLLPCEQGEIVLVVPNWFLISMKYLQEAREYYSNTRNVFASDVTWNVSEMKLGKKKKIRLMTIFLCTRETFMLAKENIIRVIQFCTINSKH